MAKEQTKQSRVFHRISTFTVNEKQVILNHNVEDNILAVIVNNKITAHIALGDSKTEPKLITVTND